MNDRKGLTKLGMGIISLVLILFMGIFLVIFYDQVIEEYYIEPLDTISHNVVNELDIDSQWNETLNSLKVTYDNRFMPFDLIFVLFFLVAFIGTSISSSKASKQGIFSFFGYIFLFSMIFLIVMFFISQFTDYFVTYIFIPLFNDTTLDVPIIFFFFENINVISFVWFMWLGLINMFDIKEVVRETIEGGFAR